MEIQNIYPSSEELSTINSNIKCTHEECNAVFKSQSNLNLHLIKTHKNPCEAVNANRQYYCPTSNCIYHKNKYFKSLKLLKQHYLKVHARKLYKCKCCDKSFPTQKYKESHEEYCGVKFSCCDCKMSYPLYESLITHGRRKKHAILEKKNYNLRLQNVDKTNNRCESKIKPLKSNSLILPKASPNIQYVNIVPTAVVILTSEKDCQTDNTTYITQKFENPLIAKDVTSQCKQSQTIMETFWSSVQTQTTENQTSQSTELNNCEVSILKNKNTQTLNKSLSNKSCNTSFELDDSNCSSFITVPKNSSTTQTSNFDSIYSISTSTHDSIHTDTSDLPFEHMHSSSQTSLSDLSFFDSSNYFNCNSETQTDFILNDNILNYNCISDTQPLKNDLELENCCTKNFDDLLKSIDSHSMFDDEVRSVESQTTMCYFSCKDVTNMETQTETDHRLKEMNFLP